MVDIPLIVNADSSSVKRATGDLIDFKQALGGVKQEQTAGARAGSAYTAQMGAGSRATAGLTAQLMKLKTAAGLAALAASALVVARAIATAGDAATQAENRLNALGLNGRDTYDGLAEAATRLGVETKSVVDTFARFALVRDEIGLTASQVQQLTENVLGLGLQSGASVQETASASVQLAQALASGVLQGDELKSILETMPALAKALADGLGVSIGELRTLGSEGKLVAADLAAILVDLDVDPSGFDSIAQAQTRIRNELDRVLVNLDRALNLSGLWKTVLNGVADALGLLADGTEAVNVALAEISASYQKQTAIGRTAGEVAALEQELKALQYWLPIIEADSYAAATAVQALNAQGFRDIEASAASFAGRLATVIGLLRTAKVEAYFATVPDPTKFAPGPPSMAEAARIAETMRPPASVDVPGVGVGSAGGGGGGGGAQRDRYTQEQVELAQRLRDAEKERAAILGGEDMERFAAVQDAINSAQSEGVDLTQAQIDALTAQANAVFDLEKQVKSLKDAFDAIEAAAETFGSAMGKALGDSLFGIGNFKEAATAAFKDLVSTVLEELGKLAASKILQMILGGGLGGGFSLNLGSLGIPGFASGGMHSGGLRVVGERGPEIEATGAARYWSNADLKGAVGGGFQQTVNITNNAGVDVETRTSDDGRVLEILIERAEARLADGLARGTGPVGRTLEGAYGLRRQGR